MKFFGSILNFLEATMKTPTNFSWFHLMFIAIAILITALLCIKFKNCDDKIFRRIVFIGWILLVVLEVYKQIVFTFDYDGTTITGDYQWYAFPFQFCSTPLFALPFIAFLKDGKVRDAVIMYMATFSLFAGLAVFVYPNDVFIETIGINIQTMIHHGSQIVFGIFFAAYFRKKLNLKRFLSSIAVFAVFCSIAIFLNIIVHHAFIANGIDETFNMFYISPYYPCTLPILSTVYEKVHYSIFIILYIFGFALVAYIIYSIEKLIINLSEKGKKNVKLQ